jgi:hypothetical protein
MTTAKEVQALGARLVVDFGKPSPDYARLMRRLLDEPAFAQAAQVVADRRSTEDQAQRVRRIANRLEEVIAGAGAM